MILDRSRSYAQTGEGCFVSAGPRVEPSKGFRKQVRRLARALGNALTAPPGARATMQCSLGCIAWKHAMVYHQWHRPDSVSQHIGMPPEAARPMPHRRSRRSPSPYRSAVLGPRRREVLCSGLHVCVVVVSAPNNLGLRTWQRSHLSILDGQRLRVLACFDRAIGLGFLHIPNGNGHTSRSGAMHWARAFLSCCPALGMCLARHDATTTFGNHPDSCLSVLGPNIDSGIAEGLCGHA